MAFLSGQFVGLILGGILAFYNWRYVFLVSVPVGILGTVWAYLKLKETPLPKKARKIDVWGNITFVGGPDDLPDRNHLCPASRTGTTRWDGATRWVLASIVIGIFLLIAFPIIESRVEDPMFRLSLFKIRVFSLANTAGFLSALARGGMMFLLIMMLQGIWLPLHGLQ